jgi:hypothetical protein
MLTLCGQTFEPFWTDYAGGVTRTAEWRSTVNEMGEIPVLEVSNCSCSSRPSLCGRHTLSVDKPAGSTYAKNPFQAWELTSLEGLMFKAVDIQGRGAQCGPYSRQPPYSSPKRSPTLRSSGALKEGRMEHSSASLQKPPATPCLKSTRRSQQVRAYKSSRGWNIQARRHRLTRQATQTVIFGADFKRAIKEASSRLRKKSIDRGKTGEG